MEQGTRAAWRVWRQDVFAGTAIVAAMLPGLLAVPSLLAAAGMDARGAYAAYLLAAAAGTLLLGIWGRCWLPAAPDAALAAWLVYGEVISHGHSWQLILACSLVSSLVGMALLLVGGRYLARAVPPALRGALVAGLGLLLVFRGLVQSRILVASPFDAVMLGNFSDPAPYLAMLGIFAVLAFLVQGRRGALLGGTALVAALALAEGFWAVPPTPFAWPEGLADVALRLDFGGWEQAAGILPALLLAQWIIPWMMLASLAPGEEATLRQRQLLVWGASALGSLWGSLPLTVPAEAAAGYAAGARSARTALVVAAGCLLLLFCEPLAAAMAEFPAIAAPVLVGAGLLLLCRAGGALPFSGGDAAERLAALCLLLLLPFSHHAMTAVGVSWLVYAPGKALAGKAREVLPAQWGMAALFLLYFMAYGA